MNAPTDKLSSKQNLPNTANATFGRIFYLFTFHFVQALTQIIQHQGGLQAFQGEHTYQQQPFQPFQRVFLLFRGMNE